MGGPWHKTHMLVPFIMLQVNASLTVFGVTSMIALAPYTRIPIDTSGCSSEYIANIVASFQDSPTPYLLGCVYQYM